MMKILKTSLVASLGVALAGCAGMGGHSSSGQYVKAKNVTQVQTKVVREYIPVPVPGQLMPVPPEKPASTSKGMLGASKATFKSREAAVKHANEQAMQYPDQNDFFNAMMTYGYMPGAVYTIYTAPLKITDVVLERGEKLISQAAGDTLRWQIAQTYSGEGDNLQQHILVKPNKPDLENSVIITTNKRTYHLLFKSTNGDSYMVSVKWNYPTDMVQTFSGNLPSSASSSGLAGSDEPASGDQCPSFEINKMNFDYTWKMHEGKQPDWAPQQIFSVGRQTYIKFPQSFMQKNGNMPMLEVADMDEKRPYATMVNWRFQCGYIIVDSIIDRARLVSGVKSKDNKVVVQITKK